MKPASEASNVNQRQTFSSFLLAHPKRSFFLAALLLVCLLYGRSLASPFVYDDLDQIVNNPNLDAWTNFAPRFLLHPVHLTSSLLANAGSTYRPLFWLSLFADRQIWGLAPFGFHLTNLVLHLANGCLAFQLLRRLSLDTTAAFVAGLLWLSLPINSEAVAWTSGRSYLLCTFFVLATLLFTLTSLQPGSPHASLKGSPNARHRGARSGVTWALGAASLLTTVCAILSIVCAILSNELGILALPLLLLLALYAQPGQRKQLFLTGLAAALAICLVQVWRVHLGATLLPAIATPRWILLALSLYLQLITFPLHMSLERSTSMTLGHLTASSWLVLGCLALAFVSALWRRRAAPWLLPGLVWFVLCIAPFCLLRNYQGLAERFAYLASLGLVVALVPLCFRPPRPALQPALRSALFSLLGLWCLGNLVRTSLRVADWSDPVRLYQASLNATPQSPSLHYNLAFSFRERGNLSQALTEYRRTLDLDPRFPNGYASLGDVYFRQDRYPEAQAAYRQALALAPGDPAVLLNSGAAFQNAGDAARAEQVYQQLLRIDPANSAAHTNLGVLYVAEQRTTDAMHQFAMAIDLKTRDIVPFYNLGALFQQAGRPDLALVLYKKVLEIKPDDADTLRNLQLIQGTH